MSKWILAIDIDGSMGQKSFDKFSVTFAGCQVQGSPSVVVLVDPVDIDIEVGLKKGLDLFNETKIDCNVQPRFHGGNGKGRKKKTKR